MLEDGRFDVRFLHPQIEVAFSVRFKQPFLQVWTKFPISVQSIQIAFRNTTTQMPFNVLDVLCFRGVDVAGDIKVEIVLFNLLHTDHSRVFGQFQSPFENIDDLMDVLSTKPILVPVLQESFAGINHENAFANVCILFVQNDDASRDTSSVKEIGGKTDDSFDEATPNQVLANIRFCIPSKQNSVR